MTTAVGSTSSLSASGEEEEEQLSNSSTPTSSSSNFRHMNGHAANFQPVPEVAVVSETGEGRWPAGKELEEVEILETQMDWSCF